MDEDSHREFKRIEFRGDGPTSPKRYAWADEIVAFTNAGGSIVPGKDLCLTDADGNELSVCALAIKSRSVLAAHRPYPERAWKK